MTLKVNCPHYVRSMVEIHKFLPRKSVVFFFDPTILRSRSNDSFFFSKISNARRVNSRDLPKYF